MKVEDIEKYGVTARGKQELLKYLNGEQLTRKEGRKRLFSGEQEDQ